MIDDCNWPRVCENSEPENPSGNPLLINYVLKLNNGFQWSEQELEGPIMQHRPTCEKSKIVFTHPRPTAALTDPQIRTASSSAMRRTAESSWLDGWRTLPTQ